MTDYFSGGPTDSARPTNAPPFPTHHSCTLFKNFRHCKGIATMTGAPTHGVELGAGVGVQEGCVWGVCQCFAERLQQKLTLLWNTVPPSTWLAPRDSREIVQPGLVGHQSQQGWGDGLLFVVCGSMPYRTYHSNQRRHYATLLHPIQVCSKWVQRCVRGGGGGGIHSKGGCGSAVLSCGALMGCERGCHS